MVWNNFHISRDKCTAQRVTVEHDVIEAACMRADGFFTMPISFWLNKKWLLYTLILSPAFETREQTTGEIAVIQH